MSIDIFGMKLDHFLIRLLLNLMHLLTLTNLLQVIDENVVVRDSKGKEIESQLLPLLNVSVAIRNYHVTAYLGKHPRATPSYWLAFSATVPPLGFSTYIVSYTKRAG
jgi:alpha-mannosidase